MPLAPGGRSEEGRSHEREAKRKQFDEEVKKLFEEKGKAKDDAETAGARRKRSTRVKKQQRETVNAPLPFATAYAVAEGKTIGNVTVQLKGDPDKAGEPVPRRFLTVLGGHALPADDSSSGRLALADWIASPENPLTARVMVNRVWQHHFGRGLVATPNDFGKQGQPPTHPELLDYLARSLHRRSGWSLKAMHRLILLSADLSAGLDRRRAGTRHGRSDQRPARARFRRRRLDAESIRDTLLAVSGQPRPHARRAASVSRRRTTWNFTQHNPFKAVYDTNRRSVYLMTQRIQRHPYPRDLRRRRSRAPAPPPAITSTTPLQALYLLNDPFVHEQAEAAREATGRRAIDRRRTDRPAPIALLFARPPTADERVAAGLDYLTNASRACRRISDAWRGKAIVRALLRLNEFVYVELTCDRHESRFRLASDPPRHRIRSLVGGSLLLPAICRRAARPAMPSGRSARARSRRTFPPKAKRVIFLFSTGGVSHMDTFDHKPELFTADGKTTGVGGGLSNQQKRRCVKPLWEFKPGGKCGTLVSDLFPHLREQMDDICLIRSMKSDDNEHYQATLAMHTGSFFFTRPSIGSWVSYGLGTVNQNLPSFVVLAPHLPYAGDAGLRQRLPARLPPGHARRPRHGPDRQPRPPHAASAACRNSNSAWPTALNRQHLAAQRQRRRPGRPHPHRSRPPSACRPRRREAFDLAKETDATLALYGLKRGQTDGFGWQCLVARRLAERGVRFIELIDTRLDQQLGLARRHGQHAPLAKNDRPADRRPADAT